MESDQSVKSLTSSWEGFSSNTTRWDRDTEDGMTMIINATQSISSLASSSTTKQLKISP